MLNKNLKDYNFEQHDWLFYLNNVFKNTRWKVFYKIFCKHIRRPWSRLKINDFAPSGVGLEVGCGTWTIAPSDRTILSDAFSTHGVSHSLAKVYFDASEIPYEKNTFSFILSEHVLEHIYDPIKTINEWKRVLTRNGKVILFLPHAERMFDRDRARTTFDQLNQRAIGKKNEIKEKILEDWMKNVISKGLASHYSHIAPEDMLIDGTIHYNVWTTEDIVFLLQQLGFKLCAYYDIVQDRKDSFLVIAEKN
jgi:SAM-dependent methyltransferase